MTQSALNRLNELITIRDIMEPIGPDLYTNCDRIDASEIIQKFAEQNKIDPLDAISIVYDNNNLLGYTDVIELSSEDPLESPISAAVIAPGNIISSTTPLLEALNIFAKSREENIFILDGGAIKGFINERSFTKPIFRICILALLLEVEELSLNLINRKPLKSVEVLSRNRLKKSIETMTNVYRNYFIIKKGKVYLKDKDESREPTESFPYRILSCTSFIDKGTIIAKRKLLQKYTYKQIRLIFKKMEKIRNSYAHTRMELSAFALGDYANALDKEDFFNDLKSNSEKAYEWHILHPRRRFVEFIEEVRRLIQDINEALQT